LTAPTVEKPVVEPVFRCQANGNRERYVASSSSLPAEEGVRAEFPSFEWK
jgi:hypothetical protein